MISSDFRWPDGLAPNTVCFTVDVEWASPPVLDDLRRLFDDHGVVATFFTTHAGVDVPGHERGLHPNFRRSGDTYRALSGADGRSDEDVHNHIVATTLSFAPEAKGVRSHSLYYDSTLLPLYRRLGIEYDCSYQLPLVEGLRPFWKHHGIVEIPTYYADHLDVIEGITGFDIGRLALDRPGIKVLDFHPNIVYLNAPTDALYASTKNVYHDPARLLAVRHPGRGIRTFLIELLAHVASRRIPTAPAGVLNALWRSAASPKG
jgi:hypothetical protein